MNEVRNEYDDFYGVVGRNINSATRWSSLLEKKNFNDGFYIHSKMIFESFLKATSWKVLTYHNDSLEIILEKL